MKNILTKLKEKDRQTIIRLASITLALIVLIASGIFFLINKPDKTVTSVMLLEESGENAVASDQPTTEESTTYIKEANNESSGTTADLPTDTSKLLDSVTDSSVEESGENKTAANQSDKTTAKSDSSQKTSDDEEIVATIAETQAATEAAAEPQTDADLVEEVTMPDKITQQGTTGNTHDTSASTALQYYVNYYQQHGYTVVNAATSSDAREQFISQINSIINNQTYNTYDSSIDGYVSKIVVIAPQNSSVAEEFSTTYNTYTTAYSDYNSTNAGLRHLTVMNLSTNLLGQSLQSLEDKRISICWFGYEGDGYDIATAQLTALCSGTQYTEALNKAKTIAATYNSGSTYDKVYNVYQYFCNNMTYDYDEVDYNNHTEAHSPYGSLVENLAVCDGFASGYALVMNQLGIDCNVIVNYNHAWNEVCIDGEWYFIDVTMGVNYEGQNLAGFLYGQDLMNATSDQKVVYSDIQITWNTSLIDYYGYASSGVNSSTTSLGSVSYLVKNSIITLK